MKIFVCIKYVPDTAEVEVVIDDSGTGIKKDRFSFDINDADNYALEEAILLKEKLGGEVSVLSMGPVESELMLRTALAKGADQAIRIEEEGIPTYDPLLTARILAQAIPKEADLVLTGCMGNDMGHMTVGIALAQYLAIPFASMIKDLQVLEDGKMEASRELEGGLMEVVHISSPCLLTIQTGINEPRYASIRGIRQARKKELTVVKLEDLGLDPETCTTPAISLEKLYIPEVVSTAQFLEGEPGEKAEQLAAILVKEGLMER